MTLQSHLSCPCVASVIASSCSVETYGIAVKEALTALSAEMMGDQSPLCIF